MEESTTFQVILERGRLAGFTEVRTDEARNVLLRLGAKHLGIPGAAVRRVLAGADLADLETWLDKLLETESWDKLLA